MLRNIPVRPVLRQLSLRNYLSATAVSDPMELLRAACSQRNLCDESGFRLPGVHWTFAVACPSSDEMKPAPRMKTVGFQRVSNLGIDFVLKRGSRTSQTMKTGLQISVLAQFGRYVSGEHTEQWRAEGHCEAAPLADVVHVLPDFTVAQMVASKRMEEKGLSMNDDERCFVESTSILTQIVQEVRAEIADDTLAAGELEASIKAYRFYPDRIERMIGGPDSVLWDRVEWTQESSSGNCPEGSMAWRGPKILLPH